MTSATRRSSGARSSSGSAAAWALLVGALALAMLITAFGYRYSRVTPDETTLAWTAKQAADGRVPYLDFFAFLPPLTLYGIGWFFRVAGASLGALRMLTIVWLAATTVILFLLLVRASGDRVLAAALALMLPGALVPFWALPSHHWFGLGFGLAAQLAIAGERPSAVQWFAAGVLTACAGLTLQTTGMLFALLLLAQAALAPAGGEESVRTAVRRSCRFAAAGLALPVAVAMLALWRADALGAGVWNLVVWPLRYYKQPGGHNDAGPAALAADAPATTSLLELTQWAGFLFALSAAVILMLSLPAGALIRRRLGRSSASHGGPALTAVEQEQARTRWITSAIGAILMWIVYAAGRVDWQHLAYVLPVALYLLVREVDWRRERVRPALLRAWAVAGTTAGVLLFWGVRWKDAPPSISAVMAVDADLLKTGVPMLADLLPRARQEGLPILYLAQGGSALYFYWAPSPPPVDWLQPPSSRYNSPREYAAVARFAEEHEVPYVVTTAAYAEEFVRIGSPIGALLSKHYRQAMETPWGIAFERVRTAP